MRLHGRYDSSKQNSDQVQLINKIKRSIAIMSSLLQRYLQFYITAISLSQLLLVVIAPTVAAQNEHSMPDFCSVQRPKKARPGCDEKRWFVHNIKGCKPYSLYCRDQTEQLDTQTEINYFTSKESCQMTCTGHIVCPELSAPENGNVTSNGFSGWGGEVTYTCNEGYSLEGQKKRTCQRDATWSLSAPTCEKQCPQPPPVNHSTIAPVHNFYNKDTRIFYTCAEGYSSDITERTCESGGMWSGPEPVCQSLQMRFCREPDLIHNGNIEAPNRAVGDTITYLCDSGFILIGNATRTCGDDEQWQGDAPVCWKLNLVYYTEDNTNRMDITNQTLSLPADTRNVRIITVSSHPDPHKDSIPVWSFKDNSLREMPIPHGVQQHQYDLEFARILVSKEQEGNYTITIGGYSVSFVLDVKDEATTLRPMDIVRPAIISVHQYQEESNIGGNATFRCVIRGCPSPIVTWFHNNSVVPPGGRVEYDVNVLQHITICDLMITNVSEADRGMYKCVGNNTEGSAMSHYVRLELNNDDTQVAPQRRKRSADESASLCKRTSDPESVTLVAMASKELRRPRTSRRLRNYRFKVKKVLKGSLAESLRSNVHNKRSLRAVVLDSNMDQTVSTHLLVSDSKYIVSGRMIDDVLYISGPQSIHQYSKQLESHIQSC